MPKKSKKDEPCYTRTNKAGKKYTTCEGEQKRNKKVAKEIKTLTADTPKPKSKPKATPKPKPKATPKPKPKAKPITYNERVKFVRKNHPYGDTVAFVRIKGEKYDWDGINLKDGFGKKVGELRDGFLLERWFKGEISKYNVPNVSASETTKLKMTPKPNEKPKAKPKKKVETAEEAYKRHFREFNDPKKYPDSKLKELLENIKKRPKDFYKDRPDFQNSDKGAVRAITQILRTRNPKRDYRRVDPSLFKPRKGDLVLKS